MSAVDFPPGLAPEPATPSDIARVFSVGAGFDFFWVHQPEDAEKPVAAAQLPAWTPALVRALSRGAFLREKWMRMSAESLGAFAGAGQSPSWLEAGRATMTDAADPDIPSPLWLIAVRTYGPQGERMQVVASRSRERLEYFVDAAEAPYRKMIDFDMTPEERLALQREFERRTRELSDEEKEAATEEAQSVKQEAAETAASGDWEHMEDRFGAATKTRGGPRAAHDRQAELRNAAKKFKKKGVRDEAPSDAGAVQLDTKGVQSETGKKKERMESKKKKQVQKMGANDEKEHKKHQQSLTNFMNHWTKVNRSGTHTPSALRRAEKKR